MKNDLIALLKALTVYAVILITQTLTNGGQHFDASGQMASLIVFLIYRSFRANADRNGGR